MLLPEHVSHTAAGDDLQAAAALPHAERDLWGGERDAERRQPPGRAQVPPPTRGSHALTAAGGARKEHAAFQNTVRPLHMRTAAAWTARPPAQRDARTGGHADEPARRVCTRAPSAAANLTHTHTPLRGQLRLSEAGEENKGRKAART